MTTAKSKEQFVKSWKGQVSSFNPLYWNIVNDEPLWNELRQAQATLDNIIVRIADKLTFEDTM
jgi:hypothetical protein